MPMSNGMKLAIQAEKERREDAGEIPRPARKKIIICCDGTWQSAVSGKKNAPSNVTRLARDLERISIDEDGKVWEQVVWYDSGVGTTSGFLGTKYEGAIGAGLEGNVIEAYNFVALNYNRDDKIYCFGFSRGAYTARTIAGLISDIGICEPVNLHQFHELWEAYKANESGDRFYNSPGWHRFFDGVDGERTSQANFMAQPGHYQWAFRRPGVEVVGVFDTVGALGAPSFHGWTGNIPFGPDKYGFHNVRLNRNIKRAFHALALDEHREAFGPTLWHLPDAQPKKVSQAEIDKKQQEVSDLESKLLMLRGDGKSTLAERKPVCEAWQKAKIELINLQDTVLEPSELIQCWFPGVHINAGGGSTDTFEGKGDLEEISTMCFAWLVEQIKPYLAIDEMKFQEELLDRSALQSEFNEARREKREAIKADQEKAKHESWGQSFGRAISNGVSAIRHPIDTYYGEELGEIKIGWGTGQVIDSYTLMYKVGNGSQSRTPGLYEKDKKTKDSGNTHECIHPCVGYRLQKLAQNKDEKKWYYPAGYKGVKRRSDGHGGFEYVFGKKVLPEYKLKEVKEGVYDFERALVSVQEDRAADAYVEALPSGRTSFN